MNRSIYNCINAYKFLQQLEKPEDKETFLAQPKTLQYAMSKPSAKEEINQEVFNGNVKTSQEYKEMERKAKEYEHASLGHRKMKGLATMSEEQHNNTTENESKDLDKQKVYYYINLNELSRNLDNTQKDNFLNAPKSLQKEVMKKNIYNSVQNYNEVQQLDGDQLKKRPRGHIYV